MFRLNREISHELTRRTTLRKLRAGRVSAEEVCDADFLLRAAAKYHGRASIRECPICGAEMRNVSWIYGDNLGRRSGTARSDEEIDRIVSEVGPVTVHVVEVCGSCGWNHVLTEAVAAPVV